MVPVAQRACVISCMPPVICRMLFLASCPLYIAGRAVPCRLSGTIVESPLLTGLVPTAGCGCESGGASESCRCIRCASADFGETVLSPHAFAAKYLLGRTGFSDRLPSSVGRSEGSLRAVPPMDVNVERKYLGVLLALIGNLLISLGLNAQKYAHRVTPRSLEAYVWHCTNVCEATQ